MPLMFSPAGRFVLALSALVYLGAPVARADAPGTTVTIPGGHAALLARLGLPADLPRALVLGEVIRVAHASPDGESSAVSVFTEQDTASGNAADTLPLPLDEPTWRALLGRDANGRNLLDAVMRDRRAALLCYGLLAVDDETLKWLASERALLRRIYEHHAGVLAAFGRVVRIRKAALTLPGGADAAAIWEGLIGEPMAEPARTVPELLGKDNGRLAYFVDAVAELDPARYPLVFGPAGDIESRLDHLRSVYRTFVDIEPSWKLGDTPFVRIGVDPALLLELLSTDAEGRLRHTRAFWEVVFAGTDLPADGSNRWSDLDAGRRVAPAWLIRRITEATLPVRQELVQLYGYTERLTDRLAGQPAANLAWLARAYHRYPALLLTLERMGVRDVGVLKQLVRVAERLERMPGARREIALALYQAPLAMVARAVQVRALDVNRATAVLATFAGLDPAVNGYGRAVAHWIGASLLPALGHDATVEGISAEGTLLEALAGLRDTQLATAAPVTWEGHSYRVDLAAPELVRLTEVRALQQGNTLDAVLALCDAAHRLADAADLPSVASGRQALEQVRRSLQPIEPSERIGAEPPPDLIAAASQASRDLARVRSRGDLKRAPAVASRLAHAENAALADVLTSLLYALWLGDPRGQAFLAGNVARRHDFGTTLLTSEERQQTPWRIAVETSGDGQPWHMRGALLGLDLGLARLALHRTRVDLPPRQPTLNESDRRTLLVTLALTESSDLDDTSAQRLLGWLQAGRARVLALGPAMLTPVLDSLGIDPRRQRAILWAARVTPQDVPRMFLRTELVLLGRGPEGELPHAWGAAQIAATGCLCLQFPAPPAVQRFTGRAGSGLLATRMTELKLRVLELLAELRLPAALARGVLAAAMQEYLEELRPAHGDDWYTLARQVDEVTMTRFEDYVAALTAGGPLVPAAPAATPTDGHQ